MNKQENTALRKQRQIKLEINEDKRIRCYMNVRARREILKDNLSMKRRIHAEKDR
jgi:hypothetical protein